MWIFEPKIPITLWWAITFVSIAAVGWYAVRREWPVPRGIRYLLIALMACGVAGPLLIALNPMWIETIPPIPGKPMLTVLVDGTASMRTPDASESTQQSRWEKALELAAQVVSEDSGIDIRYQVFSEWVQPLTPSPQARGGAPIESLPLSRATETDKADRSTTEISTPTGHRSNLASALRQTVRNGSPLGHVILLLSDGAHNVGSAETVFHAATEARALSTPIYTTTLGSSVGTKNMSLVSRTPRMIAFPENPLTIRVNMNHVGLAGGTSQVTLLRGDQVLQSQTVRLDSNASQEIRFTLADGVSEPLERFIIEASEIPGEATTSDNRTSVLVQRLNAPIGVLVLEGKPYWDSKFLARNLANDPVVSLTSMVRVGPNRFLQRQLRRSTLDDPASTNAKQTDVPAADDWTIQEGLSSPLESAEQLSQYRLIILGRDADAYLTDTGLDHLRKWISLQGGCLLCARGAPTDQLAAKLAELLPVRWTASEESRYRASVSQHGMDTAVFDPLIVAGEDPLGSLPSLSIGAIPKPRPGLPQVLIHNSLDLAASTNTEVSNNGVLVPLVTYQPLGSGQTIVVEGSGMWRWAFLPPQHAAKDKIYPTLWQSLVQWIIAQQDMMPGQEITIRPDRATFLSGDRASATVLLRDPIQWLKEHGSRDLSVLLRRADDDSPQRFSLASVGTDDSVSRVDLGNLDVGYYNLQITTGEKDDVLAMSAFEVRDPWFESLEVDARPDIMNQIAKLSSGDVLQVEEVAQLVQKFQERLRNQNPSREVRTTLWDRPSVLLVILLSWVGTWVVRRVTGLV